MPSAPRTRFISVEGVDPSVVPSRTLSSGARIPAIGLGTFGSDHVTHSEVADAVRYAVSVGYRHFDCASVYGNEDRIGRVLKGIFAEGLRRDQVWITSKLWNDKHGEGEVIAACENSLRDLQIDYLDLYLIHWPFPNHHAPGCDVTSRNAHAVPYVHENYMRTWRKMEELVDRGLVRHIGTSNMTVPKMRLLLRDARIKPVANEMELHPHFQQPEFFRYLIENGIQPIAFSPIGSPGAARTRPHSRRHVAPRGSGNLSDRAPAGRASRGGMHQVGCPARTDPDSVFGEPAQYSWQSSRSNRRTAYTGRHVHNRETRSQLSLDQGTGLSLEGQPVLGRSLGSEWGHHTGLGRWRNDLRTM